MSNEIFDRETQLDLLVNIIPLFILGFFIVGFVLFAPFGIDPLASSIQFGLIAIPFVLLAVLTYFAALAVAGSERSGPVYLPGQASVRGAEPLEVPGEEDDAAVSDDTETAGELDGEAAESEPDADRDSEPGSGDDGDGDAEGEKVDAEEDESEEVDAEEEVTEEETEDPDTDAEEEAEEVDADAEEDETEEETEDADAEETDADTERND